MESRPNNGPQGEIEVTTATATPIQTAVDNGPFRAIVQMFEARPKLKKLTFPGFVVTLAPATGANAGGLYVKGRDGTWDGYGGSTPTYYGCISERGHWRIPFNQRDSTVVDVIQYTLDTLAVRGVEYLGEVGKECGSCCFCGLTLTDPESVEYGYGPVCAKKNGLPHSNKHGF